MGLVDKLFGGGKKNRNPVSKHGDPSDVSLTANLPVDERFTIEFKKNGGKFLYCDSFDEVLRGLHEIRRENQWEQVAFYTGNPLLKKRFDTEEIIFTENPKQAQVFFSTCEHLIAANGSILVSSHQLMDFKVFEVPENVIVFATTSQFVASLSDGLKSIKLRHKDQIPGNITTLNHFQPSAMNQQDFMTYGSSSKHLYLILLEDL
ncbi:MAG: hypothetical protein RLZZ241_1600 [Bacteroidota bacterium]|jgi:hypothetical protein